MPRERISTRSNIPISVSTSNPKKASKKSRSENLNPEVKSKPSSKTHSSKVQTVAEGAAVGERRHLSVVDFNATDTTVGSVGSNASTDRNDVFYADPKSGGIDKQFVKKGKVAKAPNVGKCKKSRTQKASEPVPSKVSTVATIGSAPHSPTENKYCPQICVQIDDHYLVKLPEGVVNIEVEDGLYEYSREVVVYLTELESVNQIPVNFLEDGTISGNMRSILVDWLVQVQHHLKLCQETLYLAVGILDTVLHRRDVDTDKLQLVGITALLVASKLEEYYPVDMKKLLHLTENSYTRPQITHMERTILAVLEFQVYILNLLHFL